MNGDESSPPKPLLRYVVPLEDRDTYLDEADPDPFRIYPNPVSNELTLEQGPGVTGAYVRLTNLTGEIVLEKIFNAPLTRVNTEVLSPGVFFIFIRTDKHSVNRIIVK